MPAGSARPPAAEQVALLEMHCERAQDCLSVGRDTIARVAHSGRGFGPQICTRKVNGDMGGELLWSRTGWNRWNEILV
jgi:hypothetical protein